MSLIVFTGPAKLSTGQVILRDALKKAAETAGFRVKASWDAKCDFLVASRHDTVKARGAVGAGKTVLTYDQFVKHLADLGVDALDPQLAEGVKEDPHVDQMPAPKPVWQEVDYEGKYVL